MELMDLVNFVIIFLSKKTLLRLSTFLFESPDCDSHSPALLDICASSDATICSTVVFSPLGNSDHFVVLVFMYFPSNSKGDVSFYRTAYYYSRADWDSLRDHLRDGRIYLTLLLVLLLLNFVSGSRLELM